MSDAPGREPGGGGHVDLRSSLDLGLRFTDLSIQDADRLRRWIFAELRRQRANAA